MRDRVMADHISDVARARNASGGAALVSFAAIASVLAASSCCLPVLPFVVAAGLAGSSAFVSAARPYLMGASVLLVAYGFYQARQAKKCSRQANVISSLLLWFSAIFVFISIFLPQVLANALADLLRHR